MNMKKVKPLLSVILTVSLVSACSHGEETEVYEKYEETSGVEVEENEQPKPSFPEAPTDPVQIVQDEGGIHTKEALAIMNNKETTTTWESFFTDFGISELTVHEIYDGLIHKFGVNYKDAHQRLAEFQPDYSGFGLDEETSSYKNIAIQLDSSGSMAGYVDGGIKMDLAKNAIKEYTSGLPSDSFISLRVYGHEGTGSDADKSLSCSSTEVMYEANRYEAAKFADALTQFKPSGWTPLAASIQGAYNDLKVKSDENSENILFIVSDGIETCGGNPVEEAQKLANSDLNVKVNIIGFDVDDAGQRQLKETAEAGNGTYYTVSSKIELSNTIYELLQDVRAAYEKDFEKANIGYQVNMHSVDVSDQIQELGSELADLAYEEKRVLYEAVYQLQVVQELPESDVEVIQNLIEERYDSILNHIEYLEAEAHDKNESKREQVFETLDAN